MKSGGWAKGRQETKLMRVSSTTHRMALCLSLQMLLPIKSVVDMAIKKMAKEHGIEL